MDLEAKVEWFQANAPGRSISDLKKVFSMPELRKLWGRFGTGRVKDRKMQTQWDDLQNRQRGAPSRSRSA